MYLPEEKVKEIVYKVLPVYIKQHPEVREFLEKLLRECPYQYKAEDRFEKMLMELQRMREEDRKKWEEWRRKWEEERKESQRKWEEWERKWEEERKENQKKWEEWERKWEEERRENQRKWEEWEKKWEEERKENQRKWEENEKRWEEWRKEWEEERRENQRKWEETQEEIKKLHRLYDVGVGALGARWGIRAESAFREAIKGILEESFPVKVERFIAKDEEGEVFGRPDQVELDLIIRNGDIIVAEIKSSMSKSDVYMFDRKVKFFEKKTGRKVLRKLIISPMVEDAAKQVAKELGIEVYTYPDYIEDL